MIHTVTMENRKEYAHYLQIMHHQRYEIYTERYQWSALEKCPTKLEIDEYDTPLATYLIAISDAGKVQGSVRLVPTDCNNMLVEKFSQYLAPGIDAPNSANIWEIDRFYVADRAAKSEEGHPVRRQLFLSMVEYALSQGVVALTGVFSTGLLRAVLSLPWEPEYLGLPKNENANERYVPLKFAIDEGVLMDFQDFTKCEISFLANAKNHTLPMPISTFDAQEMRVLSKFLRESSGKTESLQTIVEGLTAPHPNERKRAEHLLDQMIAYEEHKQKVKLTSTGEITAQVTPVN